MAGLPTTSGGRGEKAACFREDAQLAATMKSGLYATEGRNSNNVILRSLCFLLFKTFEKARAPAKTRNSLSKMRKSAAGLAVQASRLPGPQKRRVFTKKRNSRPDGQRTNGTEGRKANKVQSLGQRMYNKRQAPPKMRNSRGVAPETIHQVVNEP